MLNIEEIVNLICAKSGVSEAQVARLLETSSQNFNKKKKQGTLKLSELEKFINVVGYDLEINIINKENKEKFKVY